jgi:hypothetical protein
MNVSRNQVQGSLADTPLERILAACKRHLITGVIKVTDGHRRTGRIELRAGAVDRAEIEGQSDATTMVKLEQFAGEYELEQQLPDLTGALGGAALAEGDVSGVPFVALMRHCEDHALTCTITVTRDDETIEIEYRAGEIKKITRNGAPDEDAIVDATRWTNARFRVSAPPLDMDVEGWPVVRPNTEPFTISDAAKAARADSAQPVPVKPAAPASPPASEVVVAKPVEAKKPEPAVEAKKPEPKPEPKPVEAKKPEPAKPEPAVEAKKPEPKPEPKPVEAKKPEPKPEP